MKTIYALTIAGIFSLLLMQPSISQTLLTANNCGENRQSVSYLGTKDEMLVFEVKLHFADNEIKTLSIYDEAGNEIHSERIKTNAFTKQFMFAKNSAAKLQFTLRGKKKIMNETFQITYKTQETIEITRA